MKKVILAIVIEILLLYNFVLAIYVSSNYIYSLVTLLKIDGEFFNEYVAHYISWIILYFTSAIVSLAVIILVAIKDFPVFKPLLDKLNAHKQKRVQAKAERAEENKQAKIAELEAQLKELKND